MEKKDFIYRLLPQIDEQETDYEVVYKPSKNSILQLSDTNEHIERISDSSHSVAIVVGEPTMKRCIELYESDDESDDEYKKRINMAPLFDETELQIIKYAGLFGIYFFSIFIIMHV